MQMDLSNLYKWLFVNKLTVNISKPHFMVFHKAKHKNKINIEIIKVFIEQVKHLQFVIDIFEDIWDGSNHIIIL